MSDSEGDIKETLDNIAEELLKTCYSVQIKVEDCLFSYNIENQNFPVLEASSNLKYNNKSFIVINSSEYSDGKYLTLASNEEKEESVGLILIEFVNSLKLAITCKKNSIANAALKASELVSTTFD